MRHSISLITSLLVAVTLFAQERQIDFKPLETTVLEELAATKTPGAAVAIVIRDRIVFSKGFGVANVESGVPVTPETLFRIASTTKMLTAAALATLAERNQVDLHLPIDRYVKGLPPKLGRVTVHQLLSHTAGLRDGSSYYGPHDDDALAQFVRSWTSDYLIAEPGEIFSYSNLGYVLAGRLLEEVAKKPFADAMQEILFQPLGMQHTTLRPTMAMTYPLSQGHDFAEGASSVRIVRPHADDSRYRPAGGVFTTVNDFARFALAFLNGGTIDQKQVLPAGVMERLSTPHAQMFGDSTENPRHGYGLNLRTYRGVTLLQHGGSRIGSASLVRMVPGQRVAIIILANRTDAILMKSLEAATELLIPFQARATPSSPVTVAMTEEEMNRYVGLFANAPDYLRLELVIREGKLFLTQPGQAASSPVLKTTDNRFIAGNQTFALIPDKKGRIKFLHIAGHALRRVEP